MPYKKKEVTNKVALNSSNKNSNSQINEEFVAGIKIYKDPLFNIGDSVKLSSIFSLR